MHHILPEAPIPYNSFRRNPIHSPNPALQQIKKQKAKTAGLEHHKSKDVLGSVRKALEDLIAKGPIKAAPGGAGTAARNPAGDQGQGQGAHEQEGQGGGEGGAGGGVVKNLFEELGLGVPIRGEDGEEMYIQVIDADNMYIDDPNNNEELIAQVQKMIREGALSGGKGKKKKEQQEEEEDEVGGVPYYDDVL